MRISSGIDNERSGSTISRTEVLGGSVGFAPGERADTRLEDSDAADSPSSPPKEPPRQPGLNRQPQNRHSSSPATAPCATISAPSRSKSKILRTPECRDTSTVTSVSPRSIADDACVAGRRCAPVAARRHPTRSAPGHHRARTGATPPPRWPRPPSPGRSQGRSGQGGGNPIGSNQAGSGPRPNGNGQMEVDAPCRAATGSTATNLFPFAPRYVQATRRSRTPRTCASVDLLDLAGGRAAFAGLEQRGLG
jgi:hypothetical protein